MALGLLFILPDQIADVFADVIHADRQLDEIYEYNAQHWGEAQADRYIEGLLHYFSDVVAKNIVWRAVPAELGVDGYFEKCAHHVVYWRVLDSADVGFVAILHERMHQIERIQEIISQPN